MQAQEEAKRAELARQEEQARRAKQAQHDAWCATVEQQIPEIMERWRIRGGLYWEWLPKDYLSSGRNCPNVERAIDRYLAGGR
jgi:hypothetical protein